MFATQGDIHINGLEGPYTLVLIDGMPIVSGLSTVYGLSDSEFAIRKNEVVKGLLPHYTEVKQ
jgi:outer membrane receptor for ferrienterochelin and colicins